MRDGTQRRRPLFPDRIVDPSQLPFVRGRRRGRLPHLEKEGCSYFVTFCVRGSERRRRRPGVAPEDVAWSSEPWRGRWRPLEDQRVAAAVEAALLRHQGERYLLSAWCVMPDHVHAVVTPLPPWTLGQVLQRWKSFTAHEANRILGRRGGFWQEESFDHLIRNRESFERFVAYVEGNPVAAGLCTRPEDWPYSSARAAAG